MSFDVGIVVTILAVGAVGAVVSLVVSIARDGTKQFGVFASRVHLWVSDDLITAAVKARLRRNSIGSAIGTLAGIGVSSLWLAIGHPSDLLGFLWVVVLPAVLLGGLAGSMIVALRDQLYAHDDPGPRVARVTEVRVRDYISPARLLLAPGLAVLASVVLITAAVLSATGVIDAWVAGPSLWVVGIALALVGGGAIVARVLVGADQPAVDGLELAWSDALRADTLRGLWMCEATIAWLAVVVAGVEILRAVEPRADTLMTISLPGLALNLGILVFSLLYARGAGFYYFRYRLWPDLGDVGEIVDYLPDDHHDAVDAEIEEHRP